MERESFEDEEVAEVLNRNFIAIKVDREERPDIDHVYMTFCQMLTGQGGWPLTVFITPEQKPFYAGTYFPKKGRMGMPGLLDILDRINTSWKTKRDSLIDAGNEFTETIRQHTENSPEEGIITEDVFNDCYLVFERYSDEKYGGIGKAPKFPTPHNLGFLLRYWKIYGEEKALQMVEKTLESMYRGGIFDHIGFGFSRYSTDRKWLVPHFEKMLYDNALLAIIYTEAFQVTKKDFYASVAEKIFAYILRDMTSPEGGFYAAEDADSEGVEGKFYVWSVDEILKVLGDNDGELFCRYYDITKGGNFEGKNIPNRIDVKEDADTGYNQIDLLRQRLFEYREKRVHPFKDDKILTSWNGLMIAALSLGGRALKNVNYVQAAENAAEFIFKNLVRSDGRLLARYRDGHAEIPGYVDDYAFMVWGLIELYEATYKPYYLKKAVQLNDEMLKLFWDNENGGLYLYGSDSEALIAKPKEIYDGALPSGNSVAAANFIKLAKLTGDSKLEEFAGRQLNTFGAAVTENPSSYSYFITAAMQFLHHGNEIVIVGDEKEPEVSSMLKILNSSFYPNSVSVLVSPESEQDELFNIVPFAQNHKKVKDKSTAYVCRNFTCNSPVTSAEDMKNLLN